jgi:hypothetical protein
MEVAMAQSIWSKRKTAQPSLRAAAEDLAGRLQPSTRSSPLHSCKCGNDDY